jgi:hypothetical protein
MSEVQVLAFGLFVGGAVVLAAALAGLIAWALIELATEEAERLAGR